MYKTSRPRPFLLRTVGVHSDFNRQAEKHRPEPVGQADRAKLCWWMTWWVKPLFWGDSNSCEGSSPSAMQPVRATCTTLRYNIESSSGRPSNGRRDLKAHFVNGGFPKSLPKGWDLFQNNPHKLTLPSSFTRLFTMSSVLLNNGIYAKGNRSCKPSMTRR